MSTLPIESYAFISKDLSCSHCGYNLRGLTTDKLCPECGTPIARSIHGNLLRFADPGWLKKLRLGTNLQLWNILIMLVLSACVGGLTGFGGGLPSAVALMLQLIGSGLGLAATFLITTQEPRIALQEDTVTLRKLIRYCAVSGVVGEVLSEGPTGLALPLAGWIAAGALALAGVVAEFGELLYYRRFARRIPNEKLARSTSVVLWGLPASILLMLVSGVAFAIWVQPAIGGAGLAMGTGLNAPIQVTVVTTAPPASGPPASAGAPAPTVPAPVTVPQGPGFYAGMGFICLGGLGIAIFGIWYVVLLFRYSGAFKRALAESGMPVPTDDIFMTPPPTAEGTTEDEG